MGTCGADCVRSIEVSLHFIVFSFPIPSHRPFILRISRYLLKTQFARATCEALCAALRLSHKYEMSSIYKTLVEIFQRPGCYTMPARLSFYVPGGWPIEPLPGNWDYMVANILEESQVFSGLPTALYTCAVKDPFLILLSPLSTTNKERVMFSLRQLQTAYHKQVLQVFDTDHPDFVDCCDQFCMKSARSRLGEEGWLCAHMSEADHPLLSWDFISRARSPELCETATALCKTRWESARIGLWTKLPQFFRLEPWDMLVKRDAAYQSDMEKDSPGTLLSPNE